MYIKQRLVRGKTHPFYAEMGLHARFVFFISSYLHTCIKPALILEFLLCRNTGVVHLICHFQSEGGVLLAACFFILTLFLDNSLERKASKTSTCSKMGSKDT